MKKGQKGTGAMPSNVVEPSAAETADPSGFIEREEYESGFAAVYAAEIAPELKRLERNRQARRRDVVIRSGAVVIALLALAAGVTVLAPDQLWVLVPLVLLGAWVGYLVALAPTRDFGESVRDAVMGPLCGFVGGLQYRSDARDAIDLGRFVEAGVVPDYERDRIEDLLIGRYRGVSFAVVGAELKLGGMRGGRTVFHGLLLTIEVPRPFAGTLRIGWRSDPTESGTAGLEPIAVGHSAFAARFTIAADMAETAEDLLSPAFLDSLVAIADAVEGAAVRAAFLDGNFVLALPTGRDLFGTGSIFQPVYSCEDDIRDLLWQIAIIRRLIDYLYGDEPGQMP